MILTTVILVFIGLILADLTTACVHWAVDNYASRDWPFVGPHYVAYAHDHHDDPMELLRLSFIRCHWFILSFALLMGLFLALVGGLNTITISALIFGGCTNLIHGWSHKEPSDNGLLINLLHMFGIFQSPEHHARHHNQDSSNYALLTDYTNPVLEGLGVFPMAEKCLSRLGIQRFWWEDSDNRA